MKFKGPNKIQMSAESFLGGHVHTGQTRCLPYGGRQIKATVVHEGAGHYESGYDTQDALIRTASGEYFLAREIEREVREHTGYSGEPKFQLPGEGYWLRVKRLTTRGALLVALQHSDAALRADLLDVLPEPTRRSTTRRFADGSMAVTLHIQPEPARLVLAACEIDACSPVREVYDGLRNEVRAALERGPSRAGEIVTIFDDNAPSEDAPATGHLLRVVNPDGTIHAEAKLNGYLFRDLQARAEMEICREDWQYTLTDMLQRGLRVVNEPGKIVELDDRAMDLVERYDEENRARHEGRGIEVSDIVNGAIRSILESDLEGDTILCRDVEEAMQARNGISNDDHEEKSEVETEEEEGTATGKTADHAVNTRYIFKYPAKGERHARYREIELTPAQMEMAQKAGEAFGLNPRAFLRRLLDLNLPGQPFVLGDGSGKLATCFAPSTSLLPASTRRCSSGLSARRKAAASAWTST